MDPECVSIAHAFSLLTSLDSIRCGCFVTGGSAGLDGLNALRLQLLTTLREEHVTRRR